MIRAVLLLAASAFALAPYGVHGAEARIFRLAKLPPASALALQELAVAITAHPDQPGEMPTIVVGLCDGKTIGEYGKLPQPLPDKAESAAILDISTQPDQKKILIAGSDDRGLSYALRDAARAVAVAPKDKPWYEGLTYGVEQPFLKVRNVSLHLFNADCEYEWFYSIDFWRFYFQRLSLARFNRCTLTFCDQTNYLCPPYAYLVEMPEYPDVKVADCTTEQRAQNLKMLKRIAELADEYAIDFDLGIWMQAPVEKWAAPVQVTGLPEGMKHAEYCALGLRRILEACPSVDGLQLRMNAEAGVPEDQQTAFYKPMFQALAAVQQKQRPDAPYRLELRYKGLTQETIDAAAAEKLDVTVSTKFWAEHFGLPYHPTVVDSHYAKDRYSFGAMLKKSRNYKVTYQLWTVGSQRLTLWGDPEYCKQFAQSCTLGGGEGFEVFAPLTNKGYGNKPGAWQVIKNPEYRVGQWEQERYWAFYLAFGRMGYNPESKLDFWHREFRHRFGDVQTEWFEDLYRSASQILPLISTQLLPSASEWSWWPEMDTGGNLHEYARIQTGDPGRFAPFRSWERTPDWRWEEWDVKPGIRDGRRDDGRFAPTETCLQLKRTAERLRGFLDSCDRIITDNISGDNHAARLPEWRITKVDMEVLAGLAEYHAAKLEAASSYLTTGERQGRQVFDSPALADLQRSVDAWRKIIAATKGVYHSDLVFGVTPENARNKFGHHHSGHWRDRLTELEADLEALKKKPNESLTLTISGAGPSIRRVPHKVEHLPPDSLPFDGPLPIQIKISHPHAEQGMLLERVIVHFRPLDQTQAWRQAVLEFQPSSQGFQTWAGSIPVASLDRRYDLQYYFEFDRDRGDDSFFWPEWQSGTPYYVVPTAK